MFKLVIELGIFLLKLIIVTQNNKVKVSNVYYTSISNRLNKKSILKKCIKWSIKQSEQKVPYVIEHKDLSKYQSIWNKA